MLEFRILGPLEVADAGQPLQLHGQKQRALLALLLLDANRVVATDRIIDALWGERPPRTAATSLQNFVSQLRKLLGPELLVTKPPGYQLVVAPEQLDLEQFRRLVEEGRQEPAEASAAKLRQALALWRGPPLGDLGFESFAQPEIARLEELRLVVLEDRVEAELDVGRHGELVGELESFAEEHPLRERLRGQLISRSIARAARRKRSRSTTTRGASSSRSSASTRVRASSSFTARSCARILVSTPVAHPRRHPRTASTTSSRQCSQAGSSPFSAPTSPT